MASRNTTGKIAIVAVAVGAAAGWLFAALFLAGAPRAFELEWLALIPLLAGLGSALLWGHSLGHVSRSKLIAGLSFLALWTVAAVTAH